MVLVDHDVETDLVAQREFVEIAVQQLVADLRIVIAVGQYDPDSEPRFSPSSQAGW